ncbi:MAG: hypothetical protein AAF962_09135 [Actinomycetota bacterium]
MASTSHLRPAVVGRIVALSVGPRARTGTRATGGARLALLAHLPRATAQVILCAASWAGPPDGPGRRALDRFPHESRSPRG